VLTALPVEVVATPVLLDVALEPPPEEPAVVDDEVEAPPTLPGPVLLPVFDAQLVRTSQTKGTDH